MQKILIASDHSGFKAKSTVYTFLLTQGYKVTDLGTNSDDRVDYPDFAKKLCENLQHDQIGILVCGSGQGMAMTANKYKTIRAAVCPTVEHARLSRAHNNANVLCLAERMNTDVELIDITKMFLSTQFEGGRHLERVNKISVL